MTRKACIALVGSTISLGCAFVMYRVKLTRREALKRFEESEDGRRLTVESISFAPKIETDEADVSRELLNEYIARDRMRLKK